MSMIDAIPVRFAHVDDMDWCMHTLTVTSDAVMKRKIDFKEIIVAEMKENRVGVLELMYLWQGHKGCVPYISSIMVLNPYRRQGVGRSLLKFLESHLSDNGFDVLLSSSQLDEWPPQAWHRHMGFEECGILNGVNQGDVGEVFFRKFITK